LLDTILASPDDDTARLVYADLLQEEGDEDRAEFIRIQVELAREVPIPEDPKKPIKPSGGVFGASFEEWQRYKRANREWKRKIEPFKRRCELIRRQQYLFALHVASVPIEKGWCPTLPVWALLPMSNWSRGFIERVTCKAGEWLEHGRALTREHPIRHVKFTTPAEKGILEGDHPGVTFQLPTSWIISFSYVSVDVAPGVAVKPGDLVTSTPTGMVMPAEGSHAPVVGVVVSVQQGAKPTATVRIGPS
jgi:uncharacterized protein (TIGR02996 family)